MWRRFAQERDARPGRPGRRGRGRPGRQHDLPGLDRPVRATAAGERLARAGGGAPRGAAAASGVRAAAAARKRPAAAPGRRGTAGSGRRAATGSTRDHTGRRALDDCSDGPGGDGRNRGGGSDESGSDDSGSDDSGSGGSDDSGSRRVGRLRRRRVRRLTSHVERNRPAHERARLKTATGRRRRSALALLRDRHGLRLAGREVERPGALPGTGALLRGDDQVAACACPS